jgi:hypothetical protein
MLAQFLKVPHLIHTFIDLQKRFSYQQKFTQAFLQKYQNWQPNDGSFQKKDMRRMRDYPLQFIVFFADFFALMRQQPLSSLERQRLTTYAALLCLYDDFFDENELSTQEIWMLYQDSQSFKAQSTKQAICRDLLIDLFRMYPKNQHFEETFYKFHQNQEISKKQYQGHHLDKGIIRQISFDKGGYALLLSRLLMEHPLEEGEGETVYQLGAWFQVLDDIVDIAKDRREQMATLVTICTKIEQIEQELEQQTEITFNLLKHLKYTESSKKEALYRFQIIGTSGLVHLKRLKKLQGMGDFQINQYPEKEIQWIETRWENYQQGLKFLLKY